MKQKSLEDLLCELEMEMARAGARSMLPGEFFGEGYGLTAAQAFASYLSGQSIELGEATGSSEYSTIVVMVSPPDPGESVHAFRERHFADRQDMIDQKIAFTLAYKRPPRRPDGTPWVNQAGQPCWWIFGMTAPSARAARRD